MRASLPYTPLFAREHRSRSSQPVEPVLPKTGARGSSFPNFDSSNRKPSPSARRVYSADELVVGDRITWSEAAFVPVWHPSRIKPKYEYVGDQTMCAIVERITPHQLKLRVVWCSPVTGSKVRRLQPGQKTAKNKSKLFPATVYGSTPVWRSKWHHEGERDRLLKLRLEKEKSLKLPKTSNTRASQPSSTPTNCILAPSSSRPARSRVAESGDASAAVGRSSSATKSDQQTTALHVSATTRVGVPPAGPVQPTHPVHPPRKNLLPSGSGTEPERAMSRRLETSGSAATGYPRREPAPGIEEERTAIAREAHSSNETSPWAGAATRRVGERRS